MRHSDSDRRDGQDDPAATGSEGRASASTRDTPPGENPDKNGGSAWSRALRDVAPYLDLGWRLAGTTAFPPLLGFGLDVWLSTTPWILLGGCAVGLLSAGLQLGRLQGESS